LLVTVPLPDFVAVTVQVLTNVAVTDRAELIVTWHAPVPAQSTAQPSNREPAAADAVRVTKVPSV
jgi:hypothetical protein